MELPDENAKSLFLNYQLSNQITKLSRSQLERLLLKASYRHSDIRQLILYSTESPNQKPRITREPDELIAWYERANSPEISISTRFTLLTSITISIIKSPHSFGLHEEGCFSISTHNERYQLKRKKFVTVLGENWKRYWWRYGEELGEVKNYQKLDWKRTIQLFQHWEDSLAIEELSLGKLDEIRNILERLCEKSLPPDNFTDSENSSLTATTHSEISINTI
ncbi:hypothetical protein K7432_011907 [Basidiobolus ranarum]|uniref:Uncharacterized protein n=1 Tax=Basidiobolus ranarum TaxID=34480 RepID=A0ABR2WLH4_9FUNG